MKKTLTDKSVLFHTIFFCSVCVIMASLCVGCNRSTAQITSSGQPSSYIQTASSAPKQSSSADAESAAEPSYQRTIVKAYDTYEECCKDIDKYGVTGTVQMPYQEKKNGKLYKGNLVLDEVRRVGDSERFTASYTGDMKLS